jgi:hypothetical protein
MKATATAGSTAIRNRELAEDYAKVYAEVKAMMDRKEGLRLELLQALSVGDEILTDQGKVRKEKASEVIVDDTLVTFLKASGNFDKVKEEKVSVKKLRSLSEFDSKVKDALQFEETFKIAIR